MNVSDSTIEMDPAEAAAKAADYREIKTPSDEDRRLVAIFTALASGKQVIDLHQAIADAGLDEAGRPRLAALRASAKWCYLYVSTSQWNGPGIDFRTTNSNRRNVDTIVTPVITGAKHHWGNVRSQVPIVPPEHRVWGWKSMTVLWEVEEWSMAPQPPGDPILMKPLLGALYTVEATWELTEVEKLVLAQRP